MCTYKISKNIANKMLTSKSVSFSWEGIIIILSILHIIFILKWQVVERLLDMDGPDYNYTQISDKLDMGG